MPAEWAIEDDGRSGASLLRPGLERLRDLAAEGRIEAVLFYAPDRLSGRMRIKSFLAKSSRAPTSRYCSFARDGPRRRQTSSCCSFQGMIAE
ncbi:recombinase family protein [Bradyrhizobium sp. B097]|uniref:recombinase family protein n=1 Tax=Bradyrhizobium sp. B097 TaxID=3140244 RepID=UPI003183150C